MPMIVRLFLAAFFTAALSAAAHAGEAKAAVDEFIVSEAQSFENTLQTTWPTKGKDAKGWLAEGDKAAKAEDHRAATGYYASSALLDKKNAKTWLKLAREYLAIDTEKYGEKQTFARNGGSSAYLAFTHGKAPADQAAALAVLAGSLGAREQWRPALRIYKMSLALAADEDVQKAYDEAFNEHGFRMLNYTSDNEFERPAHLRAVLRPAGQGPDRFRELCHRQRREAGIRPRARLAALRGGPSAWQAL